MSTENFPYGPVYITGGAFKDRVMYYDDDEGKKAICYTGHPMDFGHAYGISSKYVRKPLVQEMLDRMEKIRRTISKNAINQRWMIDAESLHELWSERMLIYNALYDYRTLGGMPKPLSDKTIFLCHSSSDKGFVRKINDDLVQFGATTWLDENQIKVGDSIVGKISDGLKNCQFMAIFLSKESTKSLWTRREWQSFLSRQLSGTTLTILPILVEDCEIPTILNDLKYADFRREYQGGIKTLREALI